MQEITIKVPKNHVLAQILEFEISLQRVGEADRYYIDFQNPAYVLPFGMLYTANAIQRFRKAHPDADFLPLNTQSPYAWHMGYFKSCGFEIGRNPGEAPGSESYLPISILSIEEINRQANEEMIEPVEVIERKSVELAQVLTQQETGSIREMMSYSIREMFRNVIEHSHSPFIAYCAQYHPSKKSAEIAILDNGIGILKSLSMNPYLTLTNDREALQWALLPGISGKVFKGVKRDPNDAWQNSGYGLYAVSRLCGLGGKFLICSGDSAVSLKPKGKEVHPCCFPGTALRLDLCSKDVSQLKTILARIMKEGDELARQTNLDAPSPSAASRMLSEEFRKR